MNIVDSSLWVEYFLENDIDQSVIWRTVSFTLPPYYGMLNYTRKTNILKIWIVFIISGGKQVNLQRAVKAAFKIQGFVVTRQHGVVLRLTAEVKLDKAAASAAALGIGGGFGKHAPETGFIQRLTA